MRLHYIRIPLKKQGFFYVSHTFTFRVMETLSSHKAFTKVSFLQDVMCLHAWGCCLSLQFVPYPVGEFVTTAQKGPVHTSVKVCLSRPIAKVTNINSLTLFPFPSPLSTHVSHPESSSPWCLQSTEALHRSRPCICEGFTWLSCQRKPSSTHCRISEISQVFWQSMTIIN